MWRLRLSGVIALSMFGVSCTVAPTDVQISASASIEVAASAPDATRQAEPNLTTVQVASPNQPQRPLVGGGELNASALDSGDRVLWFWAPW